MKRQISAVMVTLAAAGILAGCGGGSAPPASNDPASGAVDGTTTASAGSIDAASAAASLGTPDSVDVARAGDSLDDLSSFGTPKEVFKAQVSDSAGNPPPTTTTGPTVGVPIGGPTTTGTTGTTSTPTTTAPVQAVNPLQADFDVDGEPVLAREGDSIPPDTQQFLVKKIAKGSVTLQLNGGLLPNGSDLLRLGVGQTITLRNQTAGESYRIRLAAVRVAR